MNFGVGCTYVVTKMSEVCGSCFCSAFQRFNSSWSCLLVGLQAYDQHLNMILGDVEETVTTVEIDEETYEELYKVKRVSAGDVSCCFLSWFVLFLISALCI